MRIQVKREKDARENRRGELKEVLWKLSFLLEATEAEQTIIRNHNLGSELIFYHNPNAQGAATTIGHVGWYARDMVGKWIQLPGAVELTWAIILSEQVVAKCKIFADLVDTAASFEGTFPIELTASSTV